MMDLKEIIKWFIPCFHILRKINSSKIFVICLFLFLNLNITWCAELNSVVSENSTVKTKNVVNSSIIIGDKNNISEVYAEKITDVEELRSWSDTSVGRTFGRPFKKMMAGLLPVIFQLGAASTWAVVAALVGVKTLLVTLFILKILLLAGAAKVGALFGSKHSHQEHWQPTPHQKEIHLHIHNGGHGHEQEEHIPISSWNRESYGAAPDPRIAYVYDAPYRAGPAAGPQTITTPFGNYVKIDSAAT